MAKKTKRRLPREEEVEEKDLDRFAGSSDEEEDADSEVEEQIAPPAVSRAYDKDNDDADHHDADVENATDEETVEGGNGGAVIDENAGDDQSISSTDSLEEQMVDPASKMANAMGRILGGLGKPNIAAKSKATTASVVLGRTVTPLQKMQQIEKEKLIALKLKRQAKKERNLSALHYPLSIATSNTVQIEGRLSVAKELEQERFHRRVATRGVVALFNAISQHQRSGNEQHETTPSASTKKQDVSKMTKHSFLDKIKSAAKSKDVSQDGDDKKRKHGETKAEQSNSSSWSALKEDYMLNPKKNWDEESSDEEALQTEITEEETATDSVREAPRKKQRAGGRR